MIRKNNTIFSLLFVVLSLFSLIAPASAITENGLCAISAEIRPKINAFSRMVVGTKKTLPIDVTVLFEDLTSTPRCKVRYYYAEKYIRAVGGSENIGFMVISFAANKEPSGRIYGSGEITVDKLPPGKYKFTIVNFEDADPSSFELVVDPVPAPAAVVRKQLTLSPAINLILDDSE